MRVALFPKQLTISLSGKTYSTIKEISDEKNVSMAESLRELIEKSLSEYTVKKTDEEVDLPF